MNRQNKLTTRQNTEDQQVQNTQEEVREKALEFNTPEELLRYDAAQTAVPRRVAERLQESVGKAPDPKPWWRRILG